MTAIAPSVTQPQKIELVLAQLANLPALSPVVARLLALTSSGKSSARAVVELIETDPSLTARLLSLLCRGDRGVRPEAATVAHAVTMLGFDTVRTVALST